MNNWLNCLQRTPWMRSVRRSFLCRCICLVLHGSPDRSYCFYELLVLLVLVGILIRARGRNVASTFRARSTRAIARLRYEWPLAIVFYVAVAAALTTIVIGMDRGPYGD